MYWDGALHMQGGDPETMCGLFRICDDVIYVTCTWKVMDNCLALPLHHQLQLQQLQQVLPLQLKQQHPHHKAAAAAAAPPPQPTAAAAPAAAAAVAAADTGIAGIANLPSNFSEFVMIWETKSVGIVGCEHLEEAIA